MTPAADVRPESWDEARDLRRFWWVLPPITFVLITLSMAWLTGFRNDASQPKLQSRSEQFFLSIATGPAPRVVVQNVEGDITVAGQDGDAVSIEITRIGYGTTPAEAIAALASLRMSARADGDYVRILPADYLPPVFKRVRADITLRVPRGSALELQTLAGKVTVSGVLDQVHILNANGDIEVLLDDRPFGVEAEALSLNSAFQLDNGESPSPFVYRATYGGEPVRQLQLTALRGGVTIRRAAP